MEQEVEPEAETPHCHVVGSATENMLSAHELGLWSGINTLGMIISMLMEEFSFSIYFSTLITTVL